MNLNNFQSPAILSGGKEFVVCTIWPEIRVPVLSYILCLNTLGKTELSAFVCLSAEFVSSVFLKSFKRSEDSYIGLADFFWFFFQEKSYMSLITADVHSYILMHL